MRRDIVFVHIPKTAGTSLRSLFEQVGRDHTVLRDYAEAPDTTPALFKLVYKDKKLLDFRKHFDRPASGILLSGHFPAERYWDYFNAESFVTFVRHPVDRVISEYVHFVNHKGWTGTLEEFVRKHGRNVQARFLKHVDLDEFGFIGFSEDFEATLPALGEYLGVNLPMRRTNVGNYATVAPALREGEKNRAMIAELNAEDMALYERLRRQRRGRPRAPGAGPDAEGLYVGQVNLRDGSTAAGFLFNDKREYIANVEISSGGQTLAVITADQYREGTRARGSRTGVCGFRVDLNGILPAGRKSGALRLAFRAQGSDYELHGSPVEFVAGEDA
jgi:hypothetical protein